MQPLIPLPFEQIAPEVRNYVSELKKKAGKIPNFYAVCANSPVGFMAMVAFREKLAAGEFSPKEREAIALLTGQLNDCEYCLRAHTVVAKMNGANDAEALAFRKGESADLKTQVLLNLTREIVEKKGFASAEAIEEFLSAGYSRAALVELVGYVSLNVFTNYLNHVAGTEPDFPAVPKV